LYSNALFKVHLSRKQLHATFLSVKRDSTQYCSKPFLALLQHVPLHSALVVSRDRNELPQTEMGRMIDHQLRGLQGPCSNCISNSNALEMCD
jgi:hypothetical protein